MKRLCQVLVFSLTWFCAMPGHGLESPRKASFISNNRSVAYEVFETTGQGPILVLLHGASGPDVPFYRSQAQYFTTKGYTVLLLHYFDATGSSAPSDQSYNIWFNAVQELVRWCGNDPKWSNER